MGFKGSLVQIQSLRQLKGIEQNQSLFLLTQCRHVKPVEIMFKYEILIPAYNSAASIGKLLEEAHLLKNPPQNIMVVDDGSTDATAAIARNGNAFVLRNERNRGKGFSLRTGFEYFLKNSSCSYLLCLDADLQHPISSIPDFLLAVERDSSSIIIGSRSMKWDEMPFLRVLSNRTTSALLSMLTKQKIKDSQCGFRLIHRRVLQAIKLKENGFQLESEFIIEAAKKGFPISFVQIPTIYNQEESNINHLGDTFRFIRLFIKEFV